MEEIKIKESLRITDLVVKYLNVQLSSEEAKELNDWVDLSPENHKVFKQLLNEERLQTIRNSFLAFDTPAALQKVKEKKIERNNIRQIRSIWNYKGIWKYSAAALIILFGGAYFLIDKQFTQERYSINSKNDLLPGSNKAILTLSNGKKISITDAKTGVLASDASLIVKKNNNGSISYQRNANSANTNALAYQTITTPRGGQWPAIELPDGTKVTLDAGSSITYPIAFAGNERKVAITGQVYFSVKHNAAMPFRVTAKGQTIEDIGTEFNINAFDDEPAIRTTLIEGSVKVGEGTQFITLIPGQQAIYVANKQLKLKQANMAEVIAWKNGLFHFDHADLKTVMRQISRWYDVDVVYEGQILKTDITGEVYRNMNASQVFEVLNNLKVDFRIDGKKIIVTNKN